MANPKAVQTGRIGVDQMLLGAVTTIAAVSVAQYVAAQAQTSADPAALGTTDQRSRRL
jgi:hypothetical protein